MGQCNPFYVLHRDGFSIYKGNLRLGTFTFEEDEELGYRLLLALWKRRGKKHRGIQAIQQIEQYRRKQ